MAIDSTNMDAHFPSTVLDDFLQVRPDLVGILEARMPALRAYARRRFRVQREQAKDLAADFRASQISRDQNGKRTVVSVFDPSKGPFRALLLEWFRSFCDDQLEKKEHRLTKAGELPELSTIDDEAERAYDLEFLRVQMRRLRARIVPKLSELERRYFDLRWPDLEAVDRKPAQIGQGNDPERSVQEPPSDELPSSSPTSVGEPRLHGAPCVDPQADDSADEPLTEAAIYRRLKGDLTEMTENKGRALRKRVIERAVFEYRAIIHDARLASGEAAASALEEFARLLDLSLR